MLAAVGLLIAQNRANSVSNVNISKEEMESWLKTMPPEQLRALTAQPNAKQDLVKHMKEMFTLSQEAERLGIVNQPDVQADLGIMEKVVLASIFREKKGTEQPKAIEVTEAERNEYYQNNPKAFDQ